MLLCVSVLGIPTRPATTDGVDVVTMRVVLVACAVLGAAAIDNGLGIKPPMGWVRGYLTLPSRPLSSLPPSRIGRDQGRLR